MLGPMNATARPQPSLEVPGKPFELRPGAGPPQVITLPLQVRARAGLHWAYGLGLLALGGLGALLVGVALSGPADLLALAISLALGGFAFVYFTATGLTLIADVLRGPAIIVDAEGFLDRRTGAAVAWREVRGAEYRYGRAGIAGLALRLAQPVRLRQNPFRVGFRRVRRDELMAPMTFLSPDAWTLSFVFETLIEQAGGEVTGKPMRDPWRLNN